MKEKGENYWFLKQIKSHQVPIKVGQFNNHDYIIYILDNMK